MNAAALHTIADLRWQPALPWWLLAALGLAAVLVVVRAGRRRPRGLGWRALALGGVLAWLAGPTLVEERRVPLADIVVAVVDQTASMGIGDRPALAEAAMVSLREQAKSQGLELHTVTVAPGSGAQPSGGPGGSAGGTRLFAALDRGLGGLPRERLAAIVAVTDGQVHDVPARLGVDAGVPLHVLLAGRPGETDRRLRLIEAPGYGVVGKSVTLRIAVDDLGRTPAPGEMVRVTLRRDGEKPREEMVPLGVTTALQLPILREGPSVVDLSVEKLPGAISDLNSRTTATLSGVRDRLRVLLVSGEPHAGERMWRRLLKADPAVDLVHFTILRPPEKDDLTPLNELALIAFPTRELFQQKVREFDLIILDRFQNRGILPLPYLRNIAEYVRQGGGLLVSVGPEFSGIGSLDDTPLRGVLPAHPVREPVADDQDAGAGLGSGSALDASSPLGVIGPFRPAVTALGTRHPVTADLPGWRAEGPAAWGRWYRRIGATELAGQMLLSAPDGSADGAPLLLLDRVGTGRVALLLSDQIWLWARGHDGGGPQAELMRRIAHWLMKQPDLEENALAARIEPAADATGGDKTAGDKMAGDKMAGETGRLVVTRRGLSPASQVDVTVTDPAGGEHSLRLTPSGSTQAGTEPPATTSGRLTGSMAAPIPGVWQVGDGDRRAYAAAITPDPREIEDLRASDESLSALARASGGGIHWLAGDPGSVAGTPQLRPVDAARLASGRDWIGVPRRGGHVTASIALVPLLPDWLALIVLLGAVGLAWWREAS